MDNGNNDFLSQGYQVHRSLDRFNEPDRAAYLAINVQNKQPVILEEFQYKEANIDEINALCQLKHPGIPQFLKFFETERGICLVQEYKKASPIHHLSNLPPEAFKYIAKSILDILIYLQNQSPVVIHQNIRPENIWFDNQRQIHLVGFGLSRKSKGIAHSGGTKTFKSREQLANRPLSKSTDLYGLGVSLICLLTGTMKKHLVKRFNYIHAGAMVLLSTIFGAGVAILPYAGLIHPLALILLIGGGFPLGGIIGWLISENQKLLSEYENLKPSLARP